MQRVINEQSMQRIRAMLAQRGASDAKAVALLTEAIVKHIVSKLQERGNVMTLEMLPQVHRIAIGMARQLVPQIGQDITNTMAPLRFQAAEASLRRYVNGDAYLAVGTYFDPNEVVKILFSDAQSADPTIADLQQRVGRLRQAIAQAGPSMSTVEAIDAHADGTLLFPENAAGALSRLMFAWDNLQVDQEQHQLIKPEFGFSEAALTQVIGFLQAAGGIVDGAQLEEANKALAALRQATYQLPQFEYLQAPVYSAQELEQFRKARVEIEEEAMPLIVQAFESRLAMVAEFQGATIDLDACLAIHEQAKMLARSLFDEAWDHALITGSLADFTSEQGDQVGEELSHFATVIADHILDYDAHEHQEEESAEAGAAAPDKDEEASVQSEEEVVNVSFRDLPYQPAEGIMQAVTAVMDDVKASARPAGPPLGEELRSALSDLMSEWANLLPPKRIGAVKLEKPELSFDQDGFAKVQRFVEESRAVLDKAEAATQPGLARRLTTSIRGGEAAAAAAAEPSLSRQQSMISRYSTFASAPQSAEMRESYSLQLGEVQNALLRVSEAAKQQPGYEHLVQPDGPRVAAVSAS